MRPSSSLLIRPGAPRLSPRFILTRASLAARRAASGVVTVSAGGDALLRGRGRCRLWLLRAAGSKALAVADSEPAESRRRRRLPGRARPGSGLSRSASQPTAATAMTTSAPAGKTPTARCCLHRGNRSIGERRRRRRQRRRRCRTGADGPLPDERGGSDGSRWGREHRYLPSSPRRCPTDAGE